MTGATLYCESDAARREVVRGRPLNGFDFVEVDCAQTGLTVTFLGRAPDWITPAHLRIGGGRRERHIRVVDVRIEHANDDGLDDRMIVTVDRPGDFSRYRLFIIDLDAEGRPTGKPPADFDVRYASVEFGFKVGCPVDQDPADVAGCPEPVVATPSLDYLAKDYQGFRQLVLDRLALTMPDWSERHAPDVGIMLVEILAYVADDLSYYQDAVATEAFLDTARLRESVRRHLRLIDYRLGEGRNAQGWARITLERAATLTLTGRDLMLTPALPGVSAPMLRADDVALDADVIVFEPDAGIETFVLHQAHNVMAFYEWGGTECCLAIGAVAATLHDPGRIPDQPQPDDDDCTPDDPPLDIAAGVADGRWHLLRLAVGDVLILAEVIGPRTGDAADADPMHRHAVRLTNVRFGWDPLTRDLVVDIEWCPEDALPFALCLSTTTGPPGCVYTPGISVAWGNVIPVDHGRSFVEDLGCVGTERTDERCDEPCKPAEITIIPRPFRPRLPRANLTFVAVADAPSDACGGCGALAASRRGAATAEGAMPAITLVSKPQGDHGRGQRWVARQDLLHSGPDDRHFVVETDAEAGATLRFGNDSNGRQPPAATCFTAHYRIGNGPAGNIGADALAHIVFRNGYPDGIDLAVSNPLTARGGAAAESAARAKLRAPHQFRRRLARAITAADYAAIVMRDFASVVQRAAASLRSTGVRTEVQVAVDARGRADADPALLACIARHLDGYRRIGHDVRVLCARQVPIDLKLTVCVVPDQIAAHVRRAVLETLGRGLTHSGQRGFFHPDALSFGESINISRLAAAVHAVEGVAHIDEIDLNRLFELPNGEVEAGLLPIGPLEIARLDQDPDVPENGRLTLTMKGGR